jgi:hypothetical protein
MKKTILIVSLIVASTIAIAQTKEKELTQAEQFSAQAGTLMERQFIDVGRVKGVDVKVLKYKDLNDGTERSALRFEYEYKSSYASDTKITSLDSDEIDGLISRIFKPMFFRQLELSIQRSPSRAEPALKQALISALIKPSGQPMSRLKNLTETQWCFYLRKTSQAF